METIKQANAILNHLHNVLNAGAALVPLALVRRVAAAGRAVGVCLCGGALSEDCTAQVLYVEKYSI